MSKSNAEKVPITAADMERFYRNAWQAIKRREGTFLFDEMGAGLTAVFLGGVPLLGLLFWDWSALQLLVFYFVGSWLGILCDFVKLRFLEKEIRAWGEAHYEDWHVWVVVDALRAGETHTAPEFLRARYQPWSGMFVDFVFGGISTLLMCIGLVRSPGGAQWDELHDSGMLMWLAGLVLYQILFTLWEIWGQKCRARGERKVRVAVGLRGVGLFVFMFLLVFVTDGFEHSGRGVMWAMLAVNGVIVLWGVGTMIGPLFLVKETRWLKSYVLEHGINVRD